MRMAGGAMIVGSVIAKAINAVKFNSGKGP
jgi:hypothetical protein